MIPIVPVKNLIDDKILYKSDAINKIKKVIDVVNNRPNIRLASRSSRASVEKEKNQLISLFINILEQLKLNSDRSNIENTIKGFSSSDGLKNFAGKHINSGERKDEIKIVSKHLKDSHYQVDISKDIITHNEKKIFMISCYARDAYLGRYLIKRNFFYTLDREDFANQTYDEIKIKIEAIKDRYYNEIIKVSSIFAHMKQILDGVISEIALNND